MGETAHPRFHTPMRTGIRLALACALACMLACTGALLRVPQAQAVTAAEKRAEADEIWVQIDALQTDLNAAYARYDEALAAHDAAIEARDAAQARIDEETERIAGLEEALSAYAVATYKRDAGTFLDVLLQTESFSDFTTSLDAVNAVSAQGVALLQETKAAREAQEQARADFQEQSEIAAAQMAAAEEEERRIEETQAALREEAERITAEAAELQAQEELAAEAARQAEEARKAREAALAAAVQAAASGDVSAAAGASVLMGSGYFTNPCPQATNSSGFGYRSFDNSFHKGLDMAAPEGTPYYAADSGTVMYATNDGGWNGGAGNWVVISHGNGIVTKYMHSSATFVKPGDYVERGQNIGLVGNTGQSFGAHLHFQVEVDGIAVNPLNYI